jgi:hypothetical protein
MWKRVVWTDEASFITSDFGLIYITWKPEERYLSACYVPKVRGYSSWMIRELISSSQKGWLTVFEKQWGKIMAKAYT